LEYQKKGAFMRITLFNSLGRTLLLAAAACIVGCGDNGTTPGTGGNGAGTGTTYKVTYDGNGNDGGTAPTDNTPYRSGAEVTVRNAGSLVKTGYTFSGWNTRPDGNGNSYSAGETFFVTGNTTLYARWIGASVTTYAVAVSGGTGGGNYVAGATVTVSATVPSGQRFVNWTAEGVSLADNGAAAVSFAMPANAVTLTARFEALPTNPPGQTQYSLNVTVTPSGGGTVGVNGNNYAGPITFNAGAQATVVAVANSGYTFMGWSGASMSTNASVTITMNGNKALTANFTQITLPPGGGNVEYVTIGGKTWMSKNLNVHTSEGSYCYNNSEDSCAKYGRLYTWETAMNGASSSSTNPSGVRGICPAGWHLPSNAELVDLVTAVGGNPGAGTKLKSTSGWNYHSDSYYGTDEYGFSALPGGGRRSDGDFYDAGYFGHWWSTNGDGVGLFSWNIYYYNDYVSGEFSNKSYAFSVRCVGN
jgi:uncharacterized protein (TIGR02145 family)/uncharacterized repeat protein (TIGR02543 family)